MPRTKKEWREEYESINDQAICVAIEIADATVDRGSQTVAHMRTVCEKYVNLRKSRSEAWDKMMKAPLQ